MQGLIGVNSFLGMPPVDAAFMHAFERQLQQTSKLECFYCSEKTFSRKDAWARHMRVVHPDINDLAWQFRPAKERKAPSKDSCLEHEACTMDPEFLDSTSWTPNGQGSPRSVDHDRVGADRALNSDSKGESPKQLLAEKAVYTVPTISPLDAIQSNDFSSGEDFQPFNNIRIAYSIGCCEDKSYSSPRPKHPFIDKRDSPLAEKNNDVVAKMYNVDLNRKMNPSMVRLDYEKFNDYEREGSYTALWPDNLHSYTPSYVQSTRCVRKVELPLNILGSTYAACPDSGSHENIMVEGLAEQLGLNIEDSAEHQKEFRIGNGKIVKSLGRASVKCSFAKEPEVEYLCWFYIFHSLIKSVIVGMAFLDATETLTKYKFRLQCSMSPRMGPLQLCALNNPAQRLGCMAEGKRILANADTGSEIDFVSLAYAKRRDFLIIEKVGAQDSQVQFADGTLSSIAGKVSLDIFIGQYDLLSVNRGGKRLRRTFYVLEGLTSDMLLGVEFLDETDAFNTYKTALSSDASKDAFSQLNTIIWFKTPERYFGRYLFGKPSVAAPEPLDGNASESLIFKDLNG